MIKKSLKKLFKSKIINKQDERKTYSRLDTDIIKKIFWVKPYFENDSENIIRAHV